MNHVIQRDVPAITGPEVLQQAAMLHQFSDDVDGFFQCTDSIELEQFGVVDPLHHLQDYCIKVLHDQNACSCSSIMVLKVGQTKLLVTQMPKSRDLAIFLLMMTN